VLEIWKVNTGCHQFFFIYWFHHSILTFSNKWVLWFFLLYYSDLITWIASLVGWLNSFHGVIFFHHEFYFFLTTFFMNNNNNNNNLTSRHGRSLVHDMYQQNKKIFFLKKREFCFLGGGALWLFIKFKWKVSKCVVNTSYSPIKPLIVGSFDLQKKKG